MREYQARTVQELAACTCDRCQRRLTRDEPGEWQERLAIDHAAGFESVFGDGNTVSLDLCQHCVREVLGQWLRVTPPTHPEWPWQPGGSRLEMSRDSAVRYDEPEKPVDMNTDVFGLWLGRKIESAWEASPPTEEKPKEQP